MSLLFQKKKVDVLHGYILQEPPAIYIEEKLIPLQERGHSVD
jgi:hypothetical protein